MKKNIIILMMILISINIFALELSLDKAKKMALNNNNSLLSAKENLKSSTISKEKAYLNLLPSASVSGNVSNSDPKPIMPGVNSDDLQDRNISVNATITQPIFNGGKIWLGAKIQSDAEKISKQQLKLKRQSLLNDVESKYYKCLELLSKKENAKLDLESSAKHLEISKLKFERSIISKADYLKAQTAKANKNIVFIQLTNAYNLSVLDLQNSIGTYQDITLKKINLEEVKSGIAKYSQIMSNENIHRQLLNIAEKYNPNFKISILNKEIQKKSLLMSYGNFLPNLNLSYSKNWTESIDPDDSYSKSSTIALSSSIPIFPIFDNGLGVKDSKHKLKKSEYDLKNFQSQLNLGIQSSLQNLYLAAKTIESSSLAKDLASETYKQMETRYQNDLVSLTDLMDTQVMYFNALNQYTNSIYSFLEAKNNLKFQVGVENFTKISKILFKKTEGK